MELCSLLNNDDDDDDDGDDDDDDDGDDDDSNDVTRKNVTSSRSFTLLATETHLIMWTSVVMYVYAFSELTNNLIPLEQWKPLDDKHSCRSESPETTKQSCRYTTSVDIKIRYKEQHLVI